MVETGERKRIYSRIEKRPIEIQDGIPVAIFESDSTNRDITTYILGLKGIESLAHNFLLQKEERIPTSVLRELVLVDNIEADENTKLKILTYRLWAEEGKYDLVRQYLPDQTFDLEDIQASLPHKIEEDEIKIQKRLEDIVDQVIKDNGDLGEKYHLLHEASDIADELLPLGSGLSYLRKYEILTKIALEKITEYRNINITPSALEKIILDEYLEKIQGLENKTRNEFYKEKRKLDIKTIKEDTRIKVVEDLAKQNLSIDEIAKFTGYTKSTIYKIYSALYYDNRLKPANGRISEFERKRQLIFQVETILNKTDKVITNQEIADQIGTSKKRVNMAIGILYSLGRIKKRPKNAQIRRSRKTDLYEKAIKDALVAYGKQYPGKKISMEELKKISGVPLSLSTVSKIYQRTPKRRRIPPSRHGSLIRAKKILKGFFENNPEIGITYTKLSKKYGISISTFNKARIELADEGLVLWSRSNHRDRARTILESFHVQNPDSLINFRDLIRRHKIGRKVLISVYNEMREEGYKIYSREDFYRKERQLFLKRLVDIYMLDKNIKINITEIAKELGVNHSTAQIWYNELKKDHELPGLINSKTKRG